VTAVCAVSDVSWLMRLSVELELVLSGVYFFLR